MELALSDKLVQEAGECLRKDGRKRLFSLLFYIQPILCNR